MQRGTQESRSVWDDNDQGRPTLSPLRDNLTADICIVGAGIAGLTAAYLLQKAGQAVVVLDAWNLAGGETSRTTAHITAVLDDNFSSLETLFGEEGSRLAAESHRAAISRIEAIIREEQIDCDFERLDGYLVALDEDQHKLFDKEQMAAKRAGFADLEIHSRVPVQGVDLEGPTMRFPQQATFNVMKYMIGLCRAFQNRGGRIYVRSHVNEVRGGDAFAKTDEGYKVNAANIIVATNSPINDRIKIHTKQAAYRTYVVGFQIPKNSYSPFLLWDMADPYHYVRVVRGEQYDTLLAGGEDHKTGQANDMGERYHRLESWARRYFSILGPANYRWSGQVMEPVDALSFIGHNPLDEKNVYVATGDSGNGMTYGTIAGMLITDLICGRENPWAKLYDPSRVSVKATMEFLQENTNVVGRMLKDWVKPSEIDSIAQLKPGEGAVLRDGTSKIAAYRDDHGELHLRSAVCTHLGCIVQWNRGEKTWDCPCHGSRFDTEGGILNGPAIKTLAAAENSKIASEKVPPRRQSQA